VHSDEPSGRVPMKIRHLVALIVLVCATLLSSHPALAQFSQQGPKLVGTGAVGNASQGHSVFVSADGNTAIVGGYNDNNGVGGAGVWRMSGGVWTPQGAKLVGSGAVGNRATRGTTQSHSASGFKALNTQTCSRSQELPRCGALMLRSHRQRW
jgi:hypothetical protein